MLWSSGSTVTVLSSVLCESRTRWRTIRLQSASERGRWTRKASEAIVFTDQTRNFVASDMSCVWTVLPTYNVQLSSLLNFTFGLFDWASSYCTLPWHWTSVSHMSFSSSFPSPPPSGVVAQHWPWPPQSWGFLDHTRRTTVGRSPLDEWSAHCRDLYPTTHNAHKKHLCPRQNSNPQSQEASGCRRTP